MKQIRRLLAHALALAVPLCTWAQTETEPNDNGVGADALTYNTAMAGSTGACSPTNNTADWFSVASTDQGVLRVQTSMSNTGTTDLPVTVQLRNSSSSVIETYTATAGANSVAQSNTFLHRCAGIGTYYITIVNPSTTVCTNYSLTYDLFAPVYTNDAEPNQNAGAAVIAAAGIDHPGHVSFDYGDGFDYFRIQAPTDGVLSVTVLAEHAGAAVGNLFVNLRNNSSSLLVQWSATVGANGAPSTSTFTYNCAGTEQVYYLEVGSPNVCGVSYRFNYAVAAPLYADDVEPNQNSVQAGNAAAGIDYPGRVSFNYDNAIDWHRLQAPNDGVLSVTVLAENAGAITGTLFINLRNSSSTLLEQWSMDVGANGVPSTSTFTHNCTGTEAVYYLELGNPTVCGVSYRFSYTVAAPLYADDVEPNQNAVGAIIAAAGIDHPGRVSFDYDNGFDYFRLQAPTDGVLSVTVLAEHAGATVGNLFVNLRNSSSSLLVQWSAPVGANGAPSTSTFTYNCTGTEGVYYLEVGSPNVCGVSYRFNYTVAAPLYADDVEPNQNAPAAILIDLDAAPATGRVSFEYDNGFDYFRVNHPGGVLSVVTRAENAGPASTMFVNFRNSSSSLILQNQIAIGGGGIGALDTTTTVGPVAAGIYYFEVGSPAICGVSYRLDCYDDDNDGVCNSGDLCANTPTGEGVNSNGCSCSQVVIDDNDVCTLDACLNGNVTNTFQDADNDLTCDANDGCPNDPNKIAPGQCGCGNPDTDTDGDLTADCNDGCPNDPNKIALGICGCGVSDVDSDGDLTADCNDLCPTDPNKIAPGICGCGVSDVDTDGDLTADCNDGCPADPNKIAPGICGCGVSDADTDGDLTVDCNDGCPNDPNKIAPSICGCGVADTDTDNDGIADCNDNCPNLSGVQGDPCDDGNALTINDVITAGCVCAGTPVSCVVDGDCNDNNPCTLDECDGNTCTFTPLPDGDGDGICDAQDNCPSLSGQQGDPCDDGNALTIGDVITPACVCAGTPVACVVNGDCNDSNPCTSDACVSNACVFTPLSDSDGDGICNAQDNCPNLFGQQGDACNDGNANTINDVITPACVCAGTPIGGGCQPTQLTNTADPIVTCGLTGVMLNGTNTLWAVEVPGANKYRFNFVNVPGQPAYTRNISVNSRSLQLFKWATLPLKAGRSYRVRVQSSFDGGASWCPYGVTCNITLSNNPQPLLGSWQAGEVEDMDPAPEMVLVPNPSREGDVKLLLEGLSEEPKQVAITLYDGFGRQVHAEHISLEGDVLNTTLPMEGMAAGIYLVNITIDDATFNQRLVRQ